MLAKSVSHKEREDTYYIRGWGRCGEFTAVLQRHGVTNYTAYMKFVKKIKFKQITNKSTNINNLDNFWSTKSAK